MSINNNSKLRITIIKAILTIISSILLTYLAIKAPIVTQGIGIIIQEKTIFAWLISLFFSHCTVEFFYIELFEGTKQIRKLIINHQQTITAKLEDYFTQSLSELGNEISNLLGGAIDDKANLGKQYSVAGSIAHSYESKELKNVYATSLDLPSKFMDNYAGYFTEQEKLNASKKKFDKFDGAEKEIYTELYSTTVPGDENINKNNQELPCKSRIVVISLDELWKDITESNKSSIVKFIDWHRDNSFGLKFFIYDKAYGVKDINKYSKDLSKHTDPKKANKGIHDFILYNDECVFGRVDPKPPQGDEFSIRLISQSPGTQAEITGYRHFFSMLWEHDHSYTFGNLYTLINYTRDDSLKNQYLSILKAVHKKG